MAIPASLCRSLAAAALLCSTPAAAQFTPQHQLTKAWKCGGDTEVRPVQSARDWVIWIRSVKGAERQQRWRIALCNFSGDFHGTEQISRQQHLDLMRLQWEAAGPPTAQDYMGYASMLADAHEMSAAEKRVSEGLAKGLLSPSSSQVRELQAIARPRRAEERAMIADFEKKNEPRYFGMRADWHLANGEPAKALDLYSKALNVDAAKRPQVQTRLGIAQYLLGQKVEAIETFDAGRKTGGTQGDVAYFWYRFLTGAK